MAPLPRRSVLGLVGPSGSGKTTLLAALMPLLRANGLSLSCVKHSHHTVDMETPGKDTWIFREAGAREVVLSTDLRHVIQREYRDEPGLDLDALIDRLEPVDLVLVEGFRPHGHPKILVYRPALGKPLPGAERLEGLLAVATDAPAGDPAIAALGVPVLPLNDPAAIVAFAIDRLGLAVC